MNTLLGDTSTGTKHTYLKRPGVVQPHHEQFEQRGVPYTYEIYTQKIDNNLTHYQLLEGLESKVPG